jgi:hypothetical protein
MAYSANDPSPVEVALKQLGSLMPIFLLFIGWLVATWRKIAKRNAAAPPPARAAIDEDERTRRVKEEVRRKIAERQAERTPAAAAARQEIPPETRRLAGGATEVFVPADVSAPPPVDYQAEQARQERLGKEIAAIEAGLPPPIATHQAYAPPPASPPPVLGWLAGLRDPLEVRRAIVLREILGPPVGLR